MHTHTQKCIHNVNGVVDAYLQTVNHIVGIIDSLLRSSAVDRGFEARSAQTKD
jgi:hypothetical protein